MRQRRRLIAVVGNARLSETDPRYQLAREVGRLLVDGGARVLTGGLGGVMEAASRGATESARYQAGDTIGLLPGLDPAQANAWVDIALPTGLDHLRNGLVANADAVIAIGGGAGSLSEMAFAWMRRRPVVALEAEGWSGDLGGMALDHRRSSGDPAGAFIFRATAATEAVAQALSLADVVYGVRAIGDL